MSREIVERNGGTAELVLMGIHRRGTHIAGMIRAEIEQVEGVQIPAGSVDITLYRDDLEVVGPRPIIGGTELPTGGIDDKCVVIVDDVAFTGRTSRAALNELSDWGWRSFERRQRRKRAPLVACPEAGKPHGPGRAPSFRSL